MGLASDQGGAGQTRSSTAAAKGPQRAMVKPSAEVRSVLVAPEEAEHRADLGYVPGQRRQRHRGTSRDHSPCPSIVSAAAAAAASRRLTFTAARMASASPA